MCSKQYWEFKEREETVYVPEIDPLTGLPAMEADGTPRLRSEIVKKPVFDRPRMKLIPPENIRLDRGASWDDPVNSSPFCIVLHPMYVEEVEARIATPNPKTGQPEWKDIGRAQLKAATNRHIWDATRTIREGNREDSKESEIAIDEFFTVWVHENFVRWEGREYVYYTAGIHHLLSDPKPLEEVYPHCQDGERPIVMGYALIETHKSNPSGKPQLTEDLQREANEIVNLRLDNVKLALNKRWKVRRGKQVDLRSIIRNVAGSITLVGDMEDVEMMETRDVTQSSYQEQDRVNADFDDVAGNFSPASVNTNRRMNETVGGMNLMAGAATQVSDLDMRVFTETWAEPVLRQMLKMEQYYETDKVILGIAGQQAQLVSRFGINEITDDFLMQELTLRINVGVGSADPDRQLQKFQVGADITQKIFGDAVAPMLDFKEISKEIWGKLGYRDGSRFLKFDAPDPMVTQLQKQLEELQTKQERKELENQTKLEVGRMQALSKVLTQVVENMGNVEEGEQQMRVEQLKQIASMIEMITQEQLRGQAQAQNQLEGRNQGLEQEMMKGLFSLAQAKETAKQRPANGSGT